MASFRDTLQTRLTSDATLMALLTGGVLDPADLPQDGGGAGSVPRNTDGVTIKPFAILRGGPDGSYQGEDRILSAGAEFWEVYLYQDVGYGTIDQAVGRIKTLLHDTYITADDRAIAHVLYTFTSADLVADELGGCPMKLCRYQVIHIRK